MARTLDLNAEQSSLMDVTLKDSDHTVLHLDIPNERTVNELENIRSELQKVKNGDRNGSEVLYDFSARILSINQDFIKVTADELKTKYNMNLINVLTFLGAYMGAINELSDQKN